MIVTGLGEATSRVTVFASDVEVEGTRTKEKKSQESVPINVMKYTRNILQTQVSKIA